jgi:hypothetical protein
MLIALFFGIVGISFVRPTIILNLNILLRSSFRNSCDLWPSLLLASRDRVSRPVYILINFIFCFIL